MKDIQEMSVEQALAQYDYLQWYDNHRIDYILECKRKAYYHLIGPVGVRLATRVGPAADFGTCFHVGLATYYMLQSSDASRETRLFAALRAFDAEWQKHFANVEVQRRYSLVRGVQLFDAYVERYRSEDEYYEVVDSEVGVLVIIKPRGHERFEPFVYTGRLDAVLKRLTQNDRVIKETKTTGSKPSERSDLLRLDRQTRGYFYMARLCDPENKISGVLTDVIRTILTEDEFHRDYFPLNQSDCDAWRAQTINIVEEWRRLKARAIAGASDPLSADNELPLNVFYQTTKACFNYGRCEFYKLCTRGITADTLSGFEVDTWHPIAERKLRVVEVS